MKKWMLLGAVIVLADLVPVSAQEPAQVPASVITTAQPMYMQSRVGMFGRIRGRRGEMMMVEQPIMQAQMVTQTSAATTTQPAIVRAEPAQMPAAAITTAQPVYMQQRVGLFGRIRGRGEMVMVPQQPVMQAQMVTPTSAATTPQSGIVQAQATVPATTTTPMVQSTTVTQPLITTTVPVEEYRRGLLGRRARRGYYN